MTLRHNLAVSVISLTGAAARMAASLLRRGDRVYSFCNRFVHGITALKVRLPGFLNRFSIGGPHRGEQALHRVNHGVVIDTSTCKNVANDFASEVKLDRMPQLAVLPRGPS